MAYEVTKRINGRDYRYLVESYRDPETKRRKAHWQYVGVVEDGGVRQPVVRGARKRTTRDDIICATARLLEFRDPEYVTVAVISATAGTSHSTFYRYFSDQEEAVSLALARICDQSLRSLPSLEDEPKNLAEAQAALRNWCEQFCSLTGLQRALRRVIGQRPAGRLRARIKRSLITEDPIAHLKVFLQRLNDAGFARIDNSAALANSIRGVVVSLRLSKVLTPPEHGIVLPQFDDTYLLIERAVFGAGR